FGLTLHGAPHAAGAMIDELDDERRAGSVPSESYLLALLLGVDAQAALQHVESFNWALRLLEARERIARMAADPEEFTDDDLEGLDEAARLVLRVASPEWDERYRRMHAEP